MGSYYSPYVNHCIRFYAKYPDSIRFNSEADKLNHKAVKLSLKGFSDNEVNAILSVYSSHGNIESNVYNVAKNLGIKQKSFWKIICDFERKVASKRGLI